MFLRFEQREIVDKFFLSTKDRVWGIWICLQRYFMGHGYANFVIPKLSNNFCSQNLDRVRRISGSS